MIVYKYVLKSDITLKLPMRTAPMSVGQQGNEIVLWACVQDAAEQQVTDRHFIVLPTGFELPDVQLNQDIRFIGTVQMTNGLVFHVFERRNAL